MGFRYFTKRIAERLGIKGWVRNRQDGSVEAFAFSTDENDMNEFLESLREGPSMGRVDDLIVEESESSANYNDFEIRQ